MQYIDLIYLNDSGFITIWECKLWRNPEARRKVIGQVLDYAKDLAKLNFSDFQDFCIKARNGEEGGEGMEQDARPKTQDVR